MSYFRRDGDGIVVAFDEVEASLLRHLVGEVTALLADDVPPVPGVDDVDARGRLGEPAGLDDPLAELTGMADPERPAPPPPADPALARLLPDGYRDDPESAGEFRRLTESELRQQKMDSAARLLADLPGEGGEVRLDRETTEVWLTALNDVRLALGTRLDVTEDMPEPDQDDPDAAAHVVYAWLTQLQDVLVQVALEQGGRE